jgi:hypothetical protein
MSDIWKQIEAFHKEKAEVVNDLELLMEEITE